LQNIHKRCADKKEKNYGAKGIVVCDEWRDYLTFKKWALAHGYSDGLTIDRIDSGKNYMPENCQWLTLSENSRKGALANGVIRRRKRDELKTV
jgi:hypothetical protein